jgi:hypothetical protein
MILIDCECGILAIPVLDKGKGVLVVIASLHDHCVQFAVFGELLKEISLEGFRLGLNG